MNTLINDNVITIILLVFIVLAIVALFIIKKSINKLRVSIINLEKELKKPKAKKETKKQQSDETDEMLSNFAKNMEKVKNKSEKK
ncbi:MAG TPA: hypothetical protein PLD27_01580 [bacterium]|nr:hypothetical protein [bacterium]HOL46597.1 hypothetical protein [bacterium]HPQ17832.1 hypothetical protein [bacterium]